MKRARCYCNCLLGPEPWKWEIGLYKLALLFGTFEMTRGVTMYLAV